MKQRIKVFSILLALLFAMSMLASCGQKQESAQTPTQEQEQKPEASTAADTSEKKEIKTLDFIWFSDGVEGDVTKAITKDYQAQNPDIEFNMIEVPYKDLETKLKVMISGGEPPSLARLTDVSMFQSSLEDLSPYIGDKDAFSKQFSDSLEGYYNINGKILAAPIDATANGLLYNKTAFQKAGVEVPSSPDKVWTWDEFITAVKTVVDKGAARYGLVIDKTPHRWSTLLYQMGGSMISEDGTKVVINSKEAVDAVNLITRLHKEKVSPDSVWVGSENPNNMFRTGQVAVHLSGSWMITNYRDNVKDFEWGVTYLPKGMIRSSVPGGKFIAAFMGSGVEKEAAGFIQYFTSKDVNSRYCSESLFISPRIDNANIDYSYGKEFFNTFAEELKSTSKLAGKDWSNSKVPAAIKDDLRDGIVQVITGETTAQEMLDKLAQKGQEALDKQ